MGSFLEPAPDGVIARSPARTPRSGDPELSGLGLVDGITAAPISAVPLLLVRPEHDFDWIVPITDDLLARVPRGRSRRSTSSTCPAPTTASRPSTTRRRARRDPAVDRLVDRRLR